jgi:cytochrome oxidase Cu insertion factor (SCO1/SenC/PrrC family)
MRKIFVVVPALAIAAALLAQSPSAAKAPGAPKAPAAAVSAPPVVPPRKADEFVIHLTDGPDKLLSSYRGKVIVLAFMYTTCPHCQHTAGVLAKVQTEYAAKGVQILGVTFDSNAQRGVPGFIQISGANFPVGYSTEDQVRKFMHLEGDYFVPMLAFIDKTGMIRSQVVSTGDPNSAADKFLLDQENTIRKELDKYLKAAAVPATKQAPKS